MMILQPDPVAEGAEDAWPAPLHPFTITQVDAMLSLGTEMLHLVLEPLDPNIRLHTIRDLQAIRERTANERAFEEQVEINLAKAKARKEAARREREERDAYLTSTEGRSEAAALFEADFIDLEDIPEPEPLIEGFLYRETLVRTFGPPKSLKSFATLDMAACISLGKDWHGRPTQQGRVLYVVAEGLRGIKKRRDAWNQHHGLDMKVQFYPKAVQLGDDEQMYRLIAYCTLHSIDYVVIDTQARSTVGVDENDNTEMGVIVDALDSLRQQTGACVHLVHHSTGSDDKKARGATAWDGAVDAEFRVKRDESSLTFITKFQKDIGEADDMEFVTLEVGNSLVLDRVGGGEDRGPDSGDIAPALVSDANVPYLKVIARFNGEPVTRTDCRNDLLETDGIKRSDSAIKKAYGALRSGGAIEQVGTGTAVKITDAGLVFLDGWAKRNPGDGQMKIE